MKSKLFVPAASDTTHLTLNKASDLYEISHLRCSQGIPDVLRHMRCSACVAKHYKKREGRRAPRPACACTHASETMIAYLRAI
ncbi:hypothetical protein KSZ_35080 [Dictyobacter formicarum]|uniref:Uncharacterized protein n=1 Tax=Dictyobacter formicarum TaxID=2778368 RepID=A0ABQ3VH49_9CHLR|nr:hypothetical protein KSZ_35080 [Dictyobacter formicarum]